MNSVKLQPIFVSCAWESVACASTRVLSISGLTAREMLSNVRKDTTFMAMLKTRGNSHNVIYTYKDEQGKIKQQFVYENPERLTYSHFFDYLTDICHELDIPTPVLLKTHIFNFAKFNHVKFVRRDFVESLDYDQLFLENIVL